MNAVGHPTLSNMRKQRVDSWEIVGVSAVESVSNVLTSDKLLTCLGLNHRDHLSRKLAVPSYIGVNGQPVQSLSELRIEISFYLQLMEGKVREQVDWYLYTRIAIAVVCFLLISQYVFPPYFGMLICEIIL